MLSGTGERSPGDSTEMSMPCEDVIQVLNDSLAQELLHSNIPARLTYTGRAGAPRAIPIAFDWTGTEFVICTLPHAAKVVAIETNPGVALTIDTTTFPSQVLLVRGTATVEVIDGVPPEYLLGPRRSSASSNSRHSRLRCSRCTSKWRASRSCPTGQSCWTLRPGCRWPSSS
jgi:hypothetical protein